LARFRARARMVERGNATLGGILGTPGLRRGNAGRRENGGAQFL